MGVSIEALKRAGACEPFLTRLRGMYPDGEIPLTFQAGEELHQNSIPATWITKLLTPEQQKEVAFTWISRVIGASPWAASLLQLLQAYDAEQFSALEVELAEETPSSPQDAAKHACGVLGAALLSKVASGNSAYEELTTLGRTCLTVMERHPVPRLREPEEVQQIRDLIQLFRKHNITLP